MKFSSAVSLLLAVAPAALALECSTGYEATDTAEKCYDMTLDSSDDWPLEFPDAATACISVSGTTMSVTYKTNGYWNLFESHVYLGGSISDAPMTSGGGLDYTSFEYAETGLRGETDYTMTIDMSDIAMDATECGADGVYTMAIVPHGKIAEICMEPSTQKPPVNWLLNTDYDLAAGDLNYGSPPMNYLTMPITCGCKPEDKAFFTPTKDASGSGDPHFKTWTGDKFDYHGECDLVLIDNPSFDNGKGLKVHVRTTRIQYFSYIEKIAIQIGDDVLNFNNDVENFLINGEPVEEKRKHHKTFLGGHHVRRDKKAISIRLSDRKVGGPKIDLFARKIGFPAVVIEGGDEASVFRGSLGLLGDWETGKRVARDGKTVLNDEDATEFALEWQVRDTEPMLFFGDARAPQFPQQCTPPAKILGNRLGLKLAEEEAKKACAHWNKEDIEDCIFDVVATRDVAIAAEGNILRID